MTTETPITGPIRASDAEIDEIGSVAMRACKCRGLLKRMPGQSKEWYAALPRSIGRDVLGAINHILHRQQRDKE